MRLTCKEASHLISADLDGRLGLGQRIALRLHLMACSACSRVRAQMGFLRRAMSAYAHQPANKEAPREGRRPGTRPPRN